MNRFRSLLGWKHPQAELEPLQAPADSVRAIGVGWSFGGAAMLTFGCIVVVLLIASISRRAA